MISSTIPPRLQRGVAVASGLAGVTVVEMPALVDGESWVMSVSLKLDVSSEFIPNITHWKVTISRSYPFGSIEVAPALDRGITVTFPHQNPNLQLGGRRISGKLCLDGPYGHRSIVRPNTDPVGEADHRLAWHLARAHEWADRAARGELVHDSDPFEVPRLVPSDRLRVVHDESKDSYKAWSDHVRTWGHVKFRPLLGMAKTLVANSFSTSDGQQVRRASGFDVGKAAPCVGFWWLWPTPIAVPPWQGVFTWGELRRLGGDRGMDVDTTLRSMATIARPQRRPMVLLIGYPIPCTWGGDPEEVHWQAVQLPKLEKGSPRGYRASPARWWERDRTQLFSDEAMLPYVETENWHQDRLQARGRLPARLCGLKVAIIGCGALGSMVAELLVRAGVTSVLLLDGDELEMGNLVRHTLTSASLGQYKAHEIAKRLLAVSPSAAIDHVDKQIPVDTPALHDLLASSDVVIDCTAADDVPVLLARPWWSAPHVFLSASLGFHARRLFVFRSIGHQFLVEQFRHELDPWMRLEQKAWAGAGETLHGAGCYSPLLPARMDDVMAGAVATVKILEDTVMNNITGGELIVMGAKPPFDGLHRLTARDEDAPTV